MSDFWNQRFSAVEYVYGTQPNQFYSQQLKKLKPGKILFPAEGEGRNAVYAATQGWQVSAFDTSSEGKRKAISLATAKKVSIDYILVGYEEISYSNDSFDAIVLIFAHMPPLKRRDYHKKLASFLKPGGVLILEAFSKNQINYHSGGPRDIDMLFSEDELREDFKTFTSLKIVETETILDEGAFHQGKAAVIRVVGKK